MECDSDNCNDDDDNDDDIGVDYNSRYYSDSSTEFEDVDSESEDV